MSKIVKFVGINRRAMMRALACGLCLAVVTIGDYGTARLAFGQSTPSFEVTGTKVNEQDVTVDIEILLTNEQDAAFNVIIRSRDGSARTNQDYYGFFQTLTFGPKQDKQVFTLTLIDDVVVEETEDFTLLILDATNNVISRHTIDIVDNDDATPTLTIEDAQVSEDVPRVAVKILLDPPAPETVTVQVRSDGDSATSGRDFLDVWQVISFAPGEFEKEVALAVINDTTVESDERFKVLLMNATVARIGRAVGTVTIKDDGDGKTPQLQIANTSVVETAGQAVVTVKLSPAATQPASVELRTKADQATDSKDYRDVYQVLHFEPGVTTKHILVPIIDDENEESDESFSVTLSDPSGAQLTDSTLKVNIVDDDGAASAPALSIKAESINESQGELVADIVLSQAKDILTSVRVSTLGDTAVSGQDFLSASSVVVFEPGETAKQFRVQLVDDDQPEEGETLTLILSEANGASIYRSQIAVTLFDDDVSNEVSLQVEDVTVSEDAGIAEVIVTLSEQTDTDVTVNVQTQADSALVPTDYYDVYETLVFAPGDTEKTIRLQLVDDLQVEEAEQLFILLSDPFGARLETARASVTIEDNDEY